MSRRGWSHTLFGIVVAVATVAAWRYIVSEAWTADGCDQVVEALAQALKPDPVRSANESVQKGDFRYLGVYGYTLLYPSIHDPSCLRTADEDKVIEGTGDFLCSAEHVKLQRQAVVYAKVYNAQITRNRVSLKLATCTK